MHRFESRFAYWVCSLSVSSCGRISPGMKFLNLASGSLGTADIAMTYFAKQG